MVTRFVCWFSQCFFDIHDYPVGAGSDGTPSHFHTYHCWRCGAPFQI